MMYRIGVWLSDERVTVGIWVHVCVLAALFKCVVVIVVVAVVHLAS